MAAYWLGIVPLVILAYSGAYLLAFRAAGPERRPRPVAALVAVLLFAAVAFLQVQNATRALRPDTFVDADRADHLGLTLNLADPTFWPRLLHVLVGAVAVAALATALFGLAGALGSRSSRPGRSARAPPSSEWRPPRTCSSAFSSSWRNRRRPSSAWSAEMPAP